MSFIKWVLRSNSSYVSDKVISLNKPIISVGREDTNDIVIKKSEISRKHAQFKIKDSALYLSDLGSANGTTVNGLPLNKNNEVTLKGGEQIKFEDETFELIDVESENLDNTGDNKTVIRKSISDEQIAKQMAMQAEDKIANPMAKAYSAKTELQNAIDVQSKITILKGESSNGDSFNLDGVAEIKIGRSHNCDVVLLDLTVSGEHAKMINSDSGWEIINLSQTNGLFVNGNKIIKKILQNKDNIELGSTVIRFETKAESSDIQKDPKSKIPEWIRNQGI